MPHAQALHSQHISVAVRVRPLDVDPSVTKDASETDNVMMIDDHHIGFIPNLSQKIQHVNQIKRLTNSFVKDTAKDSVYNQVRSASAGLGARAQSPANSALKRGAGSNWPTFIYDECFGPRECYEAYARTFATDTTRIRSTQDDVFNTIGRPAADTVMNGYHCCILAYGQTGSGKTYSMLGPCAVEGGRGGAPSSKRSVTPLRTEPSFIGFTKRSSTNCARDEVSQIQSLRAHPQRGLIVRIMEQLLETMCMRSAIDPSFCYDIGCSYYQIYREKAWDLLSPGAGGRSDQPLRLRMNERLDPYLEGLTEHPVRSVDQMLAVLDLGIRNRRVASTQHNVQSSRSHAILTINLAFGTPKETFSSRLYLVDLAGSERIGSLVSGDREHNTATSAVLLSSRNRGLSRQYLKTDEQQWQEAAAAQIAEASDINSSLSALGKVIHVLSEMRLNRHKHVHIPYRDSLLTMVLKNCFGGNAKTFMLATVSPYMRDAEESLSTLRFCSRAKLIINRPIRNNHKTRLVEMEGLRTENAQLRRQVEELEEMLRAASSAPSMLREASGTAWRLPVAGGEGDASHLNNSTTLPLSPAVTRTATSVVMADHHCPPSSNTSFGGLHHIPQTHDDSTATEQYFIAKGDRFRAQRVLADRLETSELMLKAMDADEERLRRMFLVTPRGGTVPIAERVRQRPNHHYDPAARGVYSSNEVDDVDIVDCPDALDSDGEGQFIPHNSFGIKSTPVRKDLGSPTSLQSAWTSTRHANHSQAPNGGVVPQQMNTTQPPSIQQHLRGLVESPPALGPPSAPLPDPETVRDKREKRSKKERRERREKRDKKDGKRDKSSRRRSVSSASTSSGEADRNETEMMRTLVAQLGAIAGSQFSGVAGISPMDLDDQMQLLTAASATLRAISPTARRPPGDSVVTSSVAAEGAPRVRPRSTVGATSRW